MSKTKATNIDLAGFLRKQGSPLADHVSDIMSAANRYRIDPRLIVAISGGESGFGKHIPTGSFNAWGIGPGRTYSSWTEGINGAAKLLRDGYVGKGLTSLAAIQRKWCPVGAANDPTGLNSNWLRVNGAFYESLGGNQGDVTKGWRVGASPKEQAKISAPPVFGGPVPQTLGAAPSALSGEGQALAGLSSISRGGDPLHSLRQLVDNTYQRTLQTAAAATVADSRVPDAPAPDGGSYSFRTSKEKAPSRAIQSAVDIAVAQVGKPYVFGSAGPKSFDCSGLIEYSLEKAGIATPGRLTTSLAAKLGHSVKGQTLLPGDWIISNGGGHMVMYIGGGQVVAAPHSGELVQIQPLDKFKGSTVDVRRYP